MGQIEVEKDPEVWGVAIGPTSYEGSTHAASVGLDPGCDDRSKLDSVLSRERERYPTHLPSI
jgi:hypothetical protein